MYNKTLLNKIIQSSKKEKEAQYAQGGIITDARGQWAHPGKVTRIPSNQITMQGVPYPVLGIGSNGQQQLMQPGGEYSFDGAEHVDEYPMMSHGGYVVTRSHDRKGKTHKVTGPDGTVKYFGDAKLGQHPNDPARKKAFYARHKHNLEGNPYFRAFARATWAEGGEPNIPIVGKKPTLKEIMSIPMPTEKRYEPTQGVKNLKATLSGIDLATLPFIETPYGFLANRTAGIANSVGDAYTAARYAMDGQWGNAGIDAGEALLDLVPFRKGKINPSIYGKGELQLSKIDKNLNKGLLFAKGVSYADDFHDVVPIKAQGGEMIRRADGSYSHRGLWDNIRANAGSGKEPTREMIEQEHKIRRMQVGGDSSKSMINPQGAVVKPSNGYVDIQKSYGMDALSREGIEKARQLEAMYPGTKFICTAKGCSEIASKAASSYGNDFGNRNAWDMGNFNNVDYQNPVYGKLITGSQGTLPNPKNYKVPEEILNASGKLIGLNRKNNLVSNEGKKVNPLLHGLVDRATNKDQANDSYDYADPKLYPNSRGYEHVGYALGNHQLLHGTASAKDHPAFYVVDDMSNGVNLAGYGNYEPVESISPSSGLYKFWASAKQKLGFQNGGSMINNTNYNDMTNNEFQQGGYIGYDGKRHYNGGHGTYSDGVFFQNGGEEMQRGGQPIRHAQQRPSAGNSSQQQVMQLVQAYAQKAGVDPKQILQQLQQMPPQQQQQAIQQMAQELQGGGGQQAPAQPQQQQAPMPGMANGGKFGQMISPAVDYNITAPSFVGYMQGGGSIVDYAKATGRDSSKSARKALAESMGISNYTGSATQNAKLLKMLTQQDEQSRVISADNYSDYPEPNRVSTQENSDYIESDDAKRDRLDAIHTAYANLNYDQSRAPRQNTVKKDTPKALPIQNVAAPEQVTPRYIASPSTASNSMISSSPNNFYNPVVGIAPPPMSYAPVPKRVDNTKFYNPIEGIAPPNMQYAPTSNRSADVDYGVTPSYQTAIPASDSDFYNQVRRSSPNLISNDQMHQIRSNQASIGQTRDITSEQQSANNSRRISDWNKEGYNLDNNGYPTPAPYTRLADNVNKFWNREGDVVKEGLEDAALIGTGAGLVRGARSVPLLIKALRAGSTSLEKAAVTHPDVIKRLISDQLPELNGYRAEAANWFSNQKTLQAIKAATKKGIGYQYGGPTDGGYEYAYGGINIAPSKRGTFTAAATKHGKSVQGFASQVLANKQNYSPAMVKKANFARNASKWHHAEGGVTGNSYEVGQSYNVSPEEAQRLQSLGYKIQIQ